MEGAKVRDGDHSFAKAAFLTWKIAAAECIGTPMNQIGAKRAEISTKKQTIAKSKKSTKDAAEKW